MGPSQASDSAGVGPRDPTAGSRHSAPARPSPGPPRSPPLHTSVATAGGRGHRAHRGPATLEPAGNAVQGGRVPGTETEGSPGLQFWPPILETWPHHPGPCTGQATASWAAFRLDVQLGENTKQGWSPERLGGGSEFAWPGGRAPLARVSERVEHERGLEPFPHRAIVDSVPTLTQGGHSSRVALDVVHLGGGWSGPPRREPCPLAARPAGPSLGHWLWGGAGPKVQLSSPPDEPSLAWDGQSGPLHHSANIS